MSVLSFPRIYFKGTMEWDPCTFNNNDWAAFPTYDPAAASLNWSFLQTQSITRENFTTAFRPWAITPQIDTNCADPAPGSPRVPCEWNMFGSHGVSFVQYDEFQSAVTGGDLEYGKPVTSDPLIGGPVAILGDNPHSPAKLVDTNPSSPWSSQVLFGGFSFGRGDAAFSGPREVKLFSRWLNPFRIYQSNQNAPLTQPASNIGVCFQTCIPYAKVKWPAAGASPLVDKLKEKASQPGALGVMIRFTGYVNVYFVNGFLNDIQAQPRDYPSLATNLAEAWDAWFTSNGQDTSKFFSNPCYSHIVGVVGVWNDGELASVPGGRRVNFNGTPVAAISTGDAAPQRISAAGKQVTLVTPAAPPVPFFLGPLVVHVDDQAKLISLDLGSTMPELGPMGSWPSDLAKANFGPLDFGVLASDGTTFTSIYSIPYEQYSTAAYEARAGIIDIPFPNSGTGAQLKSGSLAIQVQRQTVLVEQQYTAETDRRAIYLNEGEETAFDVVVYNGGVRAGAGVNVLVARYDGLNITTFGATSLPLIATVNPQQVNFTNGQQSTVAVTSSGSPSITTGVTVVTTNEQGVATVGISAQSASFPVLAFYPYTGSTPPAPQYEFSFIDSAFYTTIRVLPFDGAAPQAFVDFWNNGPKDPAAAFQYIYKNILYLYDMVFSVMLEFVNLGDQKSVEGSIGAIWSAIAADKVPESTSAMPVTRDLSAGKRLTLQLWIYLVANKFKVPDFNVGSIPAGWAPK
jgi:hypothetical protein